MHILLINAPHPSIGSRIPREHLPPLGLLSVGGPLIDAGHEVQLLDAEFGPMSMEMILDQTVTFAPEAILLGHSGSTSGHPIIAEIAHAIRTALPKVWIVYGGVFPAACSTHSRSQCFSHWLGAHRSQPLQLLGKPSCRGGSVLSWMSPFLQLLWPTWILDSMETQRSGKIRCGVGLASSNSRD